MSARLLKPYVSFVLFVQPRERASCDSVCQAIRKYIESDERSQITADGLDRQPPELPSSTEIRLALSFVSHRRPPWGGFSSDPSDATRSDREHHLVVVLECGELIAVHSSDARVKEHLLRKQKRLELGGVGLLTRPALEEALLAGEIATFWMGEGAARRGRRGPRSKTTYGEHLEDTVDYVADQGHTLAGARASAGAEVLGEGREGVVGVNLERSGFWLARADSLREFVTVSDKIFTRIREVLASGGGQERFTIFARYVDDLDAVERAYDLSFEVPGERPGVQPSQEEIDAFDWLGARMAGIEGSGRRTARLTIAGAGAAEARIRVKPDRSARGSVEFSMSQVDGDGILGSECLRLMQLLTPRIYYESGHTVTERGVIEESFIDIAFGGWIFDPLERIDISKEKTGNDSRRAIAEAGGDESDRSLFGWVIRLHQTGWLYCDDGSDELCDFVHFDDESGHLTVWHVKHCDSGDGRSIAAVPYEQVCAQVVKNMPSLSVPRLIDELEERQERGETRPMWREGRSSADLRGMIQALREPRANLRVTASVLQPHVTEKLLKRARLRDATGLHGEHQRLRRLDQLLISTDDSVGRLGARLQVVTATS